MASTDISRLPQQFKDRLADCVRRGGLAMPGPCKRHSWRNVEPVQIGTAWIFSTTDPDMLVWERVVCKEECRYCGMTR